MATQTNTGQSGVPPKEDTQTIVEERIVKFNGDHVIMKYLKGKFLGKGGSNSLKATDDVNHQVSLRVPRPR